MTLGPGFTVAGLTVGATYTGVIPLWSDTNAPAVFAAIDSTVRGPLVTVKGAATARVAFVATATTHTLTIEPETLAAGQIYGDTWVGGYLLVAGNYLGDYFPDVLYQATPVTVYDYEPQQGAQVDYIAADPTGAPLGSVRVTIPRWGTWLKSPGRPYRNTRAYLEQEGAVVRPAKRQVITREAGGLPVVLSQARGAMEGDVRLLALEGEQDAAVVRLLSEGNTLLLDTDPAWAVPWRYISVGEATSTRPHEGTLGLDRPARLHALAGLVEQPAPVGPTVVEAGRSYADLPELFGSYLAIPATVPTYEALGTGES